MDGGTGEAHCQRDCRRTEVEESKFKFIINSFTSFNSVDSVINGLNHIMTWGVEIVLFGFVTIVHMARRSPIFPVSNTTHCRDEV